MFSVKQDELFADVSKRCFILPKLYLRCILRWPTQNYSALARIAFIIQLFFILHLELAQFLYLIWHKPDIIQFTLIMSTLSTTLQGITKTTIIYVHSHRLRTILDQAIYSFWPSNLMGNKLEKFLRRVANFVQFNMLCVTMAAMVFAVGFLSKPIFDGAGQLPFISWYPFNWRAPVIYECTYLVQVVTNIFFVVLSILGHDFIFLALTTNVIAQYHLLNAVVDHLGSGNDRQFAASLPPTDSVSDSRQRNPAKQLMVQIIEHHTQILHVCAEIEHIFSPTLFVQLATSMVAICVSSFLLTAVSDIDMDVLAQLASYCLGHVLQLFIICAAGSEMAYMSESLCINAYTSCWNRQNTDIHKGVTLIILRAQRAVRVTALGIFEMNYATFIAVMRLSFSFYTFLTRIIE